MPACIVAAASLWWGGLDAHALIHQITTKVWALFGFNQGDFLFLSETTSCFSLDILLLNPNKNVSVLVCKWQFAYLLNSYGTCLILYVLSKDKYISCVCWYTLHLCCLTWTLNCLYAPFAASICGLSTWRSTPTTTWRTSREGSGNSSEEAAELSGLVTREHQRS